MNPLLIILFIIFLPCLLPCMPCIISSAIAYYASGAGNTPAKAESFNNQTGKFCPSCGDKSNINQCNDCFNCGYCVDKSGKGTCIGIDGKKGSNLERCDRLYTGDDFDTMVYQNQNYKLSYGPKQGNRVIGVNPC